jgi:hypothetical protein
VLEILSEHGCMSMNELTTSVVQKTFMAAKIWSFSIRAHSHVEFSEIKISDHSTGRVDQIPETLRKLRA